GDVGYTRAPREGTDEARWPAAALPRHLEGRAPARLAGADAVRRGAHAHDRLVPRAAPRLGPGAEPDLIPDPDASATGPAADSAMRAGPPDLSVIVPTRGEPVRLARLLDALERQTLDRARWELIVAVDAPSLEPAI